MASSSFSTAAAATASAVTKTTSSFPHLLCNTSNNNVRSSSLSRVSFRVSPKPKLRFFTKPGWKSSTVVKAQLNEVAIGGPSNDSTTPQSKSDTSAVESKDSKPSDESSAPVLATEESISEFIAQVTRLVKLVDSRDIVELQLKQLDCEVVIRKKEALPQPPSPAPVAMMHSFPPSMAMPATPPPAVPAPSIPSSSAPATSPPPPPAAKSSKSSTPPLKCPMAGTFYRSAAPGEPPFVKVGDKVQKGQTLCIIEAMKLMNEIEADRSGTITEILVEDGKAVSVDLPLFVIEP
ncbi:biotin carboxyl carrier protein of acetyl-CoA carboxylase chloroplastic isoform X2 [Tripterygium wilfordii]|uniref:Biotin carboxyl carrier protein of acetyl-CoA carboxylase n=1 Tax=Tripterygium wilfordii TaxID=458696 RepID=A0A7J7D5G6_TRIWF|nr:biotin carboxyl carrier protein of acetyl-CoA carboxylase 1, chloroplastic-like isoform X2 [Tripterygium wilfordii]KAF5741562.1 biotin carboxyl carrier protein of acetyl-CoA carboxylase chloroplastic isoform X2 [Tripterygium wilfordii]